MNQPTSQFDHPLYKPMWMKFRTPEVNALDEKIQQWIYCGISGAIILGDARAGKTTAIEILYNSYKSRGSNNIIPAHLYIISKRDRTTIANCYRGLYMSTGEKLKISYNADKLFDHMIEFFSDLAACSDEGKVLLFIDEFQRLDINQMDVFADLQNHLRERRITLLIYFVGNLTESDKLLLQSQQKEFDHLRGRFFTQQYRFNGIHNLKQIKACLRSYDTLRFPELDGPTYTEYFLPNEYAKGWRLESLAPMIWSVFNEHQKSLNLPSWGMKYFVSTINPLLTDYLPNFGVEKVNANMIERCVQVSGLSPQIIRQE